MTRSRANHVQAFALGASVAGLAVSAYLTSVHYAAAQLVCTTAGPINCERVLASGYAVIAGSSLPTSAAGVVWFAGSAAVAAATWLGIGRSRLPALQIVWSSIGLLTVVYLLFVEIVLVGALCLWCTAAHVLVVAIFLVTVTIRRSPPEGRRR